MERSGWFDDDDDDSPSEPLPDERAWRHPSELGPHGAFGAAAPRRRAGTRFVAALTLGTAGSLVIALLASVHAFGPTGQVSSASNAIEGSVVGGASGFTLAPTTSALVAVLTSVETSPTTMGASMPPVVKVHTADPNHTIRAALVDDGSLVTTIEELGDTTEGEAVLADGRTVKVTVYHVDVATGMAHLRAATAVDGAAERDAAWMGVSCGDGHEPAPATAAPAAAPDPSSTTLDVPSTTVGDGTGPTASSAPADGATPAATAATTTTLTTASPSRVSPSTATSAASTTVAPAAIRSTVSTRVGPTTDPATTTTSTTEPVAALGVTTTTETTPATTTTSTAATVAGVRVLAVFANSPAAGILQPGDLITAVDGRTVHSTWALVLAVRQHPAGTMVTIEFVRDGHRLERSILLAPAPSR